jgi:hypothetical protein
MDWGFFNKNCQKNKYLRKQIIYSSKYFYYFVIIINILFRYIWIIKIFIYFKTSSDQYNHIIDFTFGFIELFRRSIWNFFRLENEHLNNCGQFRAIRDIYLRHTSITSTEHLDKIEKENQLEQFHYAKQRHSITNFINHKKK